MKFTCYSNDSEKSILAKTKIERNLVENGWTIDEINPELIITVGGDGTVLAAVQKYLHKLKSCSFLGINTGTLGFFTDYQEAEIDLMLDNLLNCRHSEIERKLLVQAKLKDSTYYALNEIRLENNIHTQVFEVYIDNKEFEIYRGSGLNFSTQAGSTGYNCSLRGAIMDDEIQSIQMSEIAPIVNRLYRSLGHSLILNPNRVIKLKWKKNNQIVLGYDHLSTVLDDDDQVEIRISDKEVKFIHHKDIDFKKRIRMLF